MRVPVLAFLLLLPACLPWPHHQRRAPALSGVILSEEGPRAGIRVHRRVNHPPRSAADQCLGEESVLTDAEGRFSFPEQKKLLLFIVFGDRLDEWSLCFEDPDGSTRVFSDSAYWGGPPSSTLTCDLEASPKAACVPESTPTP